MNRLTFVLGIVLLILPACGPKRPEIPSEPEAAAQCAVPIGARVPVPEKGGRKGPDGTILLHMPTAALQQPRVPFQHTTHEGLACENCHSTRGGNLVLRIDFTQTCPHELCQGCHESMAERGTPTGPVTCGGCHKGRLGQ
jgi:hypothetical protein